MTSENGDYILTLLPSGPYRLVFDLAGFQRVERSVGLAPTQTLPLPIEMGVAGVTEAVQVVGRAADVLTQTSQVATNFQQDADVHAADAAVTLPRRDVDGARGASHRPERQLLGRRLDVVRKPVHGERRGGQREPARPGRTTVHRGRAAGDQRRDLRHSAEFGRFGGGVVNMVTKSGGNLFSGSFRER